MKNNLALLSIATLICLSLFALNSILCRMALIEYAMSPAQYTILRASSAAAMLVLLCLVHHQRQKRQQNALSQAWHEGTWGGGCSLFAYMAFFSWGFLDMPTAAGTLIINASVQFGMVGWGIFHGLRPSRSQAAGLIIALVGLVVLLLPGLSATPPLSASLLMVGVGLAWSVYSLCGRKSHHAELATAGNAWRCCLLALPIGCYALWEGSIPQIPAIICALAAGAGATALGYILWYSIVPCYSLLSASIIQLSVPLMTASLAVLVLDEPITLRLSLSALLILGGIFMALRSRH